MTRPLTAPGRLVAGRYRLQSQIGGGGMGAVWLALDELLGRQVAVKQVLSPAGATEEQSDQQRQRALREGRIAARLSHPHAISVYDVALESGQPWLVMEYLPSRSLAEVLNEDGPLRTHVVAQIGAQVADALAATHAAGIVHRDVKPANILIGEGGRVEGLVKITDFGISHASGDVTLTQTGQITGTPAFLAPEVAQGYAMTEASDVFSLGATLYTCLEGTPPFGMEDNALGMLHRVAGGRITPPRRAGSLTAPLLRMLAADPADRLAMTDIRDDLAKLAAGRDGDTTTILMARTDLRSNAPGRARTAAFPAEAAAAATPTPAPAPAPAPPSLPPPPARPTPTATSPAQTPTPASTPTPTPPPARSAPPQPRKRRRGLWVAAALVVLALAGLVAVWVIVDPTGHDGGATAQDGTAATTAATTAAAPSTDDASGSGAQQSGSTGGNPTGGSSPGANQAGATDPAQAVSQFFALVPGDLRAAYALTSPAFQTRFPYDEWAGFWNDFQSVQVSNIVAQDATTARVDITYVRRDGSSTTESHVITFQPGDDGRLLLARDATA